MTKLSVNVNKIATLRNARGGNIPDLIKVAIKCEECGASGITVHPRPDQRHITYDDVYCLKKNIAGELNVEGNPTLEFLDLVLDVKPAQCTLVPDKVDAITSTYGWDTKKYYFLLKPIIKHLQQAGLRVSLFIGTDFENIDYAAKLGAECVELYTGPYANSFNIQQSTIKEYIQAAMHAHNLGLKVHAGHDLSLDNLPYFIGRVPNISEVSIGHALISESLYYGLKETIFRYLKILS